MGHEGYELTIEILWQFLNSSRPRPNRRPIADHIFKCIFLNENELILPRISLKFVPKVRINNIPALVQIMAWRLPGYKPLFEPMMVSLLTHICVTRPQGVNFLGHKCSHIVTVQLSWLRGRLDICIVMAWLHQCPSKGIPRRICIVRSWTHSWNVPQLGFPRCQYISTCH